MNGTYILQEDRTEEICQKILSKSYEKSNFLAKLKPRYHSCDPQNNTITFSFLTEDWQSNPLGIVHGGITCSMFDISFGTAARYFSHTYTLATVTLTTTFLKPIQLHDTVLITVKATSVGRTLVSMTGEAVSKQSGILTATANGTFILLKEKSQKEKEEIK